MLCLMFACAVHAEDDKVPLHRLHGGAPVLEVELDEPGLLFLLQAGDVLQVTLAEVVDGVAPYEARAACHERFDGPTSLDRRGGGVIHFVFTPSSR